jgi:tRNA nucleotidyltransferase/poly(A) polymerase
MNLIPLQKEMPEVIWNVYNKVKKVMSKLDSFDPKKDIVIGGGCLSNSYMNKPIHDIDVFVQYNEEDREIYKQLFLNALGMKLK